MVLRVPGSEVLTREAPAGILEGSGGFEVAGSEEIAEASRLTRGGAPGKSRPLQVLGSCGEASGSFLGLRRSRSGGLQGLGCVGAVWPRRSRGAARGRAAQARRARVTAAAAERDGFLGGSHGDLKEGAGYLGIRAREGKLVGNFGVPGAAVARGRGRP